MTCDNNGNGDIVITQLPSGSFKAFYPRHEDIVGIASNPIDAVRRLHGALYGLWNTKMQDEAYGKSRAKYAEDVKAAGGWLKYHFGGKK